MNPTYKKLLINIIGTTASFFIVMYLTKKYIKN
jgi:hypothetical protein